MFVFLYCSLDMTQELLDYLEAGLKMSETGESTGRRLSLHIQVWFFWCPDVNLAPMFFLLLSSTSAGRQRGQIYHSSRTVQTDSSDTAHPGLQLPLPLLGPLAVQTSQPWVTKKYVMYSVKPHCVSPSLQSIISFWFSGIAPDVLLGHRERFRDLFTG